LRRRNWNLRNQESGKKKKQREENNPETNPEMNTEHAYSDNRFCPVFESVRSRKVCRGFCCTRWLSRCLRFAKLPWLFVIPEEYLIAVVLLIKNSRASG
jgi:hypothetical protein